MVREGLPMRRLRSCRGSRSLVSLCADQPCADQRLPVESEWAPAHSSGCGARFRYTKRSDYSGLIAALRAWPSHARRRGYFQNFSRASRSALRSRPRDGDPKLVGIKQSVQVESWLLQTTVVRCSSEISTNSRNMHAVVAVVKLQIAAGRWARCARRLHDGIPHASLWRNLYKSKGCAEIEDIS